MCPIGSLSRVLGELSAGWIPEGMDDRARGGNQGGVVLATAGNFPWFHFASVAASDRYVAAEDCTSSRGARQAFVDLATGNKPNSQCLADAEATLRASKTGTVSVCIDSDGRRCLEREARDVQENYNCPSNASGFLACSFTTFSSGEQTVIASYLETLRTDAESTLGARFGTSVQCTVQYGEGRKSGIVCESE